MNKTRKKSTRSLRSTFIYTLAFHQYMLTFP